MKINVSESPAEPKTSKLDKLIYFWIKTLAIPVGFTRSGGLKLKLLSFRFMFSFLIWISPTLVLRAYLIQEIYSEINATDLVGIIVDNLTALCDASSVIFLPACIGYLVSKVHQNLASHLIRPPRLYQLLFYLFTLVGYWIFFLIWESTGQSPFLIFCVIYGAVIATLIMFSSLFVINLYTSSFVEMCRRVRCITLNSTLIEETYRLISIYRALKDGLGPALFFLFSMGVVFLTGLSYQIAKDSAETVLNSLLPIMYQLVALLNLSLVCQECYNELQENADTLRYFFSHYSFVLSCCNFNQFILKSDLPKLGWRHSRVWWQNGKYSVKTKKVLGIYNILPTFTGQVCKHVPTL